MSGRTVAKKTVSSPGRGNNNKAMKVTLTSESGEQSTKRVIVTRSSSSTPQEQEEIVTVTHDQSLNMIGDEELNVQQMDMDDEALAQAIIDEAFDDSHVPEGERTQELEDFDGFPLYWDKAIDYSEACDIILGAKRVEEEKMCGQVPQNYRGEGTFVVNLESFRNRNDVNMDGLGSWGKPCGRCRFYKYNDQGEAVRQDSTGKLDPGQRYDVKVICKRYEHPAVKGRFFKKIYTGICPLPRGPLPLAVVTYMWRGEPIEFTVEKAATPARMPPHVPVHAKQWEVDEMRDNQEASEYDGCPVYANIAIEFSEAARLILGAKPIEHSRVCARVPQTFRGTATFVVDQRSFGAAVDLRRDGNGVWGKPAGHSRYYAIDANSGDAIRVDRGNKAPGTDYDIQILSKRYEHPRANGQYVRKIFTGRPQHAKPMESCCNLAILCYYWKGEPFPFEAENIISGHNRPRLSKAPLRAPSVSGDIDPETSDYGVPMDLEPEDLDDDDSISSPSRPNLVPPLAAAAQRKRNAATAAFGIRTSGQPSGDSAQRRLMLDREYENQERMSQLLDRAEAFLDRLENSPLGQMVFGGEQIVTGDQIVVDENVVLQQNGQHFVTVPSGYGPAVNIL